MRGHFFTRGGRRQAGSVRSPGASDGLSALPRGSPVRTGEAATSKLPPQARGAAQSSARRRATRPRSAAKSWRPAGARATSIHRVHVGDVCAAAARDRASTRSGSGTREQLRCPTRRSEDAPAAEVRNGHAPYPSGRAAPSHGAATIVLSGKSAEWTRSKFSLTRFPLRFWRLSGAIRRLDTAVIRRGTRATARRSHASRRRARRDRVKDRPEARHRVG